jgi:hypothetical protein
MDSFRKKRHLQLRGLITSERSGVGRFDDHWHHEGQHCNHKFARAKSHARAGGRVFEAAITVTIGMAAQLGCNTFLAGEPLSSLNHKAESCYYSRSLKHSMLMLMLMLMLMRLQLATCSS